MTRLVALAAILIAPLCGCGSAGDPVPPAAAAPSPPSPPQSGADATELIQGMIDGGDAILPCGSYAVTTLHWPGKGPADGALISGCNIAGGTRIASTSGGPAIEVDQPMYRTILRRVYLLGGLRIDAPVTHFFIEENQFDGPSPIQVGPAGSVIDGSIRRNIFLQPSGDVIYADPSSNLNSVEFSHNWFQSPSFSHYIHLPFHTADRCQDIRFRGDVYEGPSNNIPIVIGGCAYVSFEFEHWADFSGSQPMIAEEGGANGAPLSLLIVNPVGLKLSPGIPGATVIFGAPRFDNVPCAISTYSYGQWSCP